MNKRSPFLKISPEGKPLNFKKEIIYIKKDLNDKLDE